MEATEKEQKKPMLWYWSEPENGIDLENCEKEVTESLRSQKPERLLNMYIAFV